MGRAVYAPWPMTPFTLVPMAQAANIANDHLVFCFYMCFLRFAGYARLVLAYFSRIFAGQPPGCGPGVEPGKPRSELRGMLVRTWPATCGIRMLGPVVLLYVVDVSMPQKEAGRQAPGPPEPPWVLFLGSARPQVGGAGLASALRARRLPRGGADPRDGRQESRKPWEGNTPKLGSCVSRDSKSLQEFPRLVLETKKQRHKETQRTQEATQQRDEQAKSQISNKNTDINSQSKEDTETQRHQQAS